MFAFSQPRTICGWRPFSRRYINGLAPVQNHHLPQQWLRLSPIHLKWIDGSTWFRTNLAYHTFQTIMSYVLVERLCIPVSLECNDLNIPTYAGAGPQSRSHINSYILYISAYVPDGLLI